MKGRLRPSMAWLHAWSGLVVGWVLFAVFATGTASYYRPEITRWMQPELSAGPGLDGGDIGQDIGHAAMGHEAIAASVDHAVAYLQSHARAARAWFVTPPRPGRPVVELFWRNPPGTAPGHVLLDPRTGAPARVRDTLGGDFLTQFHFELHMAPLWGRWIVGICAMIMLVALLSGIVTHRRILADLFTFRPGKAPRRSWLDAHNVAGVLALPYHLMITYTGLAVLGPTYMPWGVRAAYEGDAQALYAESGQIVRPRPPAGRPGTLAPVGPMVRQALAAFPRPLERVAIRNPQDANATVVALFEAPRGLSQEHSQIAFDGVSGRLLETSRGDLKPATRTFAALVGLHEAHFDGTALRVLFFLCGVMGCAMVATGLVLWSVARLPPSGGRPAFGLRLVRALTVGGVAGLSGAIAAYFLANRLLPVDLAGRAEWEIRIVFAVWIALALLPLVRPPRRAWCDGLAAASILWLAVVAADILTLPGHPLRRWGGDALFVWFDGAMLTLAILFALAARTVAGRARPSRPSIEPSTAGGR